MASLNLLQWREQSLWRRYKGLHSLGILFLLTVSFFAVQWVTSYSEYLSNLRQQVAEQNSALEEQQHQQKRWLAYQQRQKLQRAFMQRKQRDQRRLNAFYALLHTTQKTFHQRELLLSHSQLKLTAGYQQIQDVNNHYLWLEHQLTTAGINQQLLPQQRVLFHYISNLSEADNG